MTLLWTLNSILGSANKVEVCNIIKSDKIKLEKHLLINTAQNLSFKGLFQKLT